jgi:glycosyltransferase involved in cell wall biosynthesis
VDPWRVQLAKFGANLDFLESISPNPAQVQETDGINLLFVGVDWQRKNGIFALAVARSMSEAGLATRLHVVGCKPDIRAMDHKLVVRHGFLNKRDTHQANTLKNLYQNAHFFILPSLAECYGIAFAEAFAFGLPAIAISTGGVAAAISDRSNGFLLDPSASPDACASLLIETLADQQKYAQMRSNARNSYLQDLNWSHALKTVLEHVECIVCGPSR